MTNSQSTFTSARQGRFKRQASRQLLSKQFPKRLRKSLITPILPTGIKPVDCDMVFQFSGINDLEAERLIGLPDERSITLWSSNYDGSITQKHVPTVVISLQLVKRFIL